MFTSTANFRPQTSRNVLYVFIAAIVLVILLYLGLFIVKNWLAERRELVGHRQVNENLAQQIERDAELRITFRENEQAWRLQEREYQQQLSNIQLPENDCEIPTNILDVIDNG